MKRYTGILIPFIIVGIVGVIFILKKDFLFKEKMNQFWKNELSGILVNYKDIGRGTISIYVKNMHDTTEIGLLGFKQYMYKMQIGDSLYKAKESYVIKVYRKNDSGYYFFYVDMPPIR